MQLNLLGASGTRIRFTCCVVATVLCGAIGYLDVVKAAPVHSPSSRTARHVHAPKGNLQMVLTGARGNRGELAANLQLESSTSEAGQLACASALYDDHGHEWAPETVEALGSLTPMQSASKKLMVPEGLPAGYYRLEVTCGLRVGTKSSTDTRTASLFFKVGPDAKLNLLSHEVWLATSDAMVLANRPADEGSQ